MLYTHRAIIVVTTDVAETTNQKAQQLTGKAADLLAWTVSLSSTGAIPATHYWCNWVFTQVQWDTLNALFVALPATVRDKITVFLLDNPDPFAGKPTPQEVLTQMALKTLDGGI